MRDWKPREGAAPSTDEWFSYDASNRLLVCKGKLLGNEVGLDAARRESTLRSYNARGVVATEATVDWQRDLHRKPLGTEPSRPLETTLAEHRYDARGRLVETWSSSPSIGGSVRTTHREYYADTAGAGARGKLKSESEFYRPGASFVHQGITVDLNGAASSQRGWEYDTEGRTHIVTWARRPKLAAERDLPGEPAGPLGPQLQDGGCAQTRAAA